VCGRIAAAGAAARGAAIASKRFDVTVPHDDLDEE